MAQLHDRSVVIGASILLVITLAAIIGARIYWSRETGSPVLPSMSTSSTADQTPVPEITQPADLDAALSTLDKLEAQDDSGQAEIAAEANSL
jgi:hypothetical protein